MHGVMDHAKDGMVSNTQHLAGIYDNIAATN